MLSKKALLNYFPLIIVLLLAIFLRFLWLDKVPNAIGGDELNYVLTAKSIALYGTDLTGKWNPLSIFFFNYPPGQTQAELLYFLLIPFVGFTNFSLFWARAENGVLGVLTVYLIYLIASKLFNKQIGLAAGLISAINPWFIYLSRTSYEMQAATFFYLLSFYALMFFKGKKILLSIPILLLAFYSYIATKVFFLPFVLTMIYYGYFQLNKKKFKKEYLTVLIFSVLLVAVFFLSLKAHPSVSRLGEIFTPANPEIARQVDSIRKASVQTPLTNLIVNKYTVYFRTIIVKEFSIFSFDYLFLYGDNFFSIFSHGLFYYLDALFLILGLAFTYAKQRKTFFLLLSLTLLATIPHLIHGVSTANFTPHVSMIFPFLIIFIAVGLWGSITLFKNKIYFYSSMAVIGILYIFLLLNFLNIYFYQFPLQGNFDFKMRLLSKYITISNEKTVVYSTASGDQFSKYLFYSNSVTSKNKKQIENDYRTGNYTLNNVTFLGCDASLDPSLDKNKIIIFDDLCNFIGKERPRLSIARISDGGEDYAIFNDTVCSKYPLKPYPQILSLNQFNIGGMSPRDFCENFITR